MLERFERAELVRRVETRDADDDPSWVLARPAGKVLIADVLSSTTDSTSNEGTLPDSVLPASTRIMRSMRDAIAGKTIADCLHREEVPRDTQPTAASQPGGEPVPAS